MFRPELCHLAVQNEPQKNYWVFKFAHHTAKAKTKSFGINLLQIGFKKVQKSKAQYLLGIRIPIPNRFLKKVIGFWIERKVETQYPIILAKMLYKDGLLFGHYWETK